MDGPRYSSPYAYPMDFPPPPFSIEEFNYYHSHHYQSSHFDYDKTSLFNPPVTTIKSEQPIISSGNSNSSSSSSNSSQCSAEDSRDREREKVQDQPRVTAGPLKLEDLEKKMTSKALSRARHTLQQRIKRQNETPEQKAIRRQRNAELNRRRRMNKQDIRVAMEKVKNRLRQRVKREIDRMLRTRQKRDDFLRETFEQMSAVFSDSDILHYQDRIANALQEISN
uniref:Uncharacterized protein n=1 Tax=Culex tarsalis TaxID=7177 RepID=A0A1Q3F3A8_CULTA